MSDDTNSHDNAANNLYHKKRVTVLFWAAGIATLLQLFLLTLEILGRGTVSTEMTIFYLVILGTYSGQNLLIRWKNPEDKRKGELFVFVVWGYSALVYLISVFFQKSGIIPGQLAFTWQSVTVLFFGTSLPKMIKDLFGK